MLSELKSNVYWPSHMTLKSWLFWNWNCHIHWLKNWCCFDFTSSSSWVGQTDICLLLSSCKVPEGENVSSSRTDVMNSQSENFSKHITTVPSKQQTIKWLKATKTFAKRPFLSKLNGWVSKHWNLILKVLNDCLLNVYLEILVFLATQRHFPARFHTNLPSFSTYEIKGVF